MLQIFQGYVMHRLRCDLFFALRCQCAPKINSCFVLYPKFSIIVETITTVLAQLWSAHLLLAGQAPSVVSLERRG